MVMNLNLDDRAVIAARNGKLVTLSDLIAAGADLTIRDYEALREASRVGNGDIIGLLFEGGMRPPTRIYVECLQMVDAAGRVDAVRVLLAHATHVFAPYPGEPGWEDPAADR